MAITSYSTLQSAISQWANSVELDAVITTMIALFEARANRELRTREMIERSTASTSDEYVDLPADFLEMYSLRLTGTTGKPVLKYVVPEEVKQLQAQNITGDVRWFTILGDTFQLFPAPGASTALEMVYYQKVPALSDSNTSNWLLVAAPDAYLYGSLAEASDYIRDDPRFDRWLGRADAALAKVQERGRAAMRQSVRMTSIARPF